MNIIDPLQMNDWKSRNFFIVVISIQLSMWGLFSLNSLGLWIPLLRQVVGFIYLVFIPGVLILRILKLHNLGRIRSFLFTVGLSLFSLMSIGFLINMIYPYFGISNPMSEHYIFFTISFVVLLLCALCYSIDSDSNGSDFSNSKLNLKFIFSPLTLLLILTLFLSIFGTFLVNFYDNNTLLMFLIVIISFIVLFVSFDTLISKEFYPFILWIMSISLLYHDSLISQYINKYDFIREYYYSNLVVTNSYWDWTMYSNHNSMLSTVILAPIFHFVCDLDLTWVFKIIYPLIFSFLPLGLYTIFVKIVGEKASFLSIFYFVSLNAYYNFLSSMGKQSIAEFFFVLLLILMFTFENKNPKTILLQLIFTVSIAVSHYGTSYLILFSIVFYLCFMSIIHIFSQKFPKSYNKYEFLSQFSLKSNFISSGYLILFAVFALSWYSYISDSFVLTRFILLGDHIVNTVFVQFLSPEYSRSMDVIIKGTPSIVHFIGKFVSLSILLFICIGILNLIYQVELVRFERGYIVFSIYWFILCISSIVVSGISVMNPDRLYHLSLIILAPYSVIGGKIFFKMCYKSIRSISSQNTSDYSLKFLYFFFIIFFLFNSGFVFEVTKDNPDSLSLSQNAINYGEPQNKILFMNLMFEQDVFGAIWLSTSMNKDKIIYVTKGNGEGNRPLITYGMIPISPAENNFLNLDMVRSLKNENYIYLSHLNVIEHVGIGFDPKLGKPTYFNMNEVFPFLIDRFMVYNNGGCQVLVS